MALHCHSLEGKCYETVSIQNCQGSQAEDITMHIYSNWMLQRQNSWLVQHIDETQLLSLDGPGKNCGGNVKVANA